ncbi:hypothetical protein CLIB1423_08S00408 [[Candida] railenensis]|uniref:Protein kinase domain-containing protein n=1 Tax=[Candida] railenensis TaxID=45579 RepID=A0A9P0QQ12_9ASCO|nr:hypothetical protein CLIB1423_08S00408 [[Candida] railenensis]
MDVSTLTISSDPVSHRKVINRTYRIQKRIGEGQFGKVLLAEVIRNSYGEDKYSGGSSLVAIKTINRIERNKLITKTYLSHTTKIKREIDIMKECNHPNVVKLYKVIDDLKFDKILLVLEYCEYGEIDWKSYNHYNEKYYKNGDGITINRILRDVINGLDYLHRIKNIIHRDLKPSNLLISSKKEIKISDFGVSLILENNANDEKELGKTMGTPAFFAPELCQFVNNRYSMINDKSSKIDSKIDLWSLGVILYCLVFHSLPFKGDNEFRLFKNIVTQDLKFPKTRNSTLATKADMEELKYLKDLIVKLLTKNPKERIGLQEIKEHEFTTFDLSKEERKKFIEFNKRYEERPNGSTMGKIKKLFGNTEKKTTENINLTTPTLADLNKLTQVDDLLDSYFDDSSSFGSLEEDEEDDPIDTSNILHSISYSSTSLVSPSNFKLKPPPLSISSSSNSTTTLHKPVSVSSSTGVSPVNSPTKSIKSNSDIKSTQVVTIGAGSPTLFRNMFSPSKRFFSRLGKSKSAVQHQGQQVEEPTIHSLSSPKKSGDFNVADTYFDDLRPPNMLGSGSLIIPNNGNYNNNGGSSNSSSRKNSFSSTRSNGLSRITSSSSSLNLNGYLTDDSFSLHSTTARNSTSYSLKYKIDPENVDSSENEEADETLTKENINTPTSRLRERMNMNDFLDKLD